VGVLFGLETISFDEQKLFSFMRSHLSMLSLSCCAAGVSLRKFLPIPTMSQLFLKIKEKLVQYNAFYGLINI
jgi:hypothetical protein